MTEYNTKTCPYCGTEIKVYATHLPCEGVPTTKEAIDA